jgi:deoxyribodipyrimidine photo-lyase
MKGIMWKNDESDYSAWCAGQTGYPIVDAAMRQMHSSGWMHNRSRMIVASFLTKDLLVDWRWGEKHFMQHLLDGDPASNNGGWQWTAGTGTDAAPYFRIFNPITQSKKFDPAGVYIRRWLPELANVPDVYP